VTISLVITDSRNYLVIRLGQLNSKTLSLGKSEKGAEAMRSRRVKARNNYAHYPIKESDILCNHKFVFIRHQRTQSINFSSSSRHLASHFLKDIIRYKDIKLETNLGFSQSNCPFKLQSFS
jgi:hypothetical protein